MRLTHHRRTIHLSYCTNIHAGESWDAISTSLDQYVPALKARLAASGHWPAQRAFGIGLRLSGMAALALDEPAALQALQAQLDRLGAYVFTINAFPYGPFHGARVKTGVYRPDWRDPERAEFTLRTARILAALLPEGVTGSISTVPGAFRDDGMAVGARAAIAARLAVVAAELAAIERQTGKCITLALEPEPACMLETVEDTLAFFADDLRGPAACAHVATRAQVDDEQALSLIRRHLGVCLDVCHAAVEFEDPVEALRRLQLAGIAVPKIQLSCALRIGRMADELVEEVARLDDGVYLHQVVVRGDGLCRFDDLPQALAAWQQGRARGEWRIHCHVPIFAPPPGTLDSTRAELRALLAALPAAAPVPHLEVETYTWDILPPAYRSCPKDEAIARELAFVMEEMAA